MAFESVVNPHNAGYGSVTVTGLTNVSWSPLSLPPQAVIADDASVTIHAKSSHIGHQGNVTMVDPASARALAAQVGPETFSFDAEESDGTGDATYTFAACEFGQVTEGMGTGQPANCTVSFVAKALTVT